MNNFYVYFHRRLDNNQVFYIGKGKDKRAYHKNRNIYWHNIVNKYGYNIEFFATNLTEQEAFDIEIEQIAYHRSIGVKLCNMTDGGEGKNGFPSAIAKKVINQFGDKFDSIADAAKWCNICHSNISGCCLGKYISAGKHPITGDELLWCYLGEEHKLQEKKQQLAKRISTGGERKVINQFGEIFSSIKEASEWGNTSRGNIPTCCLGKQLFAGRHPDTKEPILWAYADQPEVLRDKIEKLKTTKIPDYSPIINQFEDVFDSYEEAAKWANCKVSQIRCCCNNQAITAGKHPQKKVELVWAKLSEKNLLQEKVKLMKNRNNIKKKVINQFGDVFDSIQDASVWCNYNPSHISNCCKQKIKSAGKHPKTGEKLIWKFFDA